MRAIDADRLQKQFDKKSTNPNYRVNMHNIKSIISNAPTVEAISKADYENRLKADMVAMLEEIDLQFDEICFCRKAEWKTVPEIKAEYKAVIQQKINALKGDSQ